MSYDYWGLQPKLQDVIRSFSLLEKYGLIEKAMIYGNKDEIRYTLVDSKLKNLSYELMSAHSLESDYLGYKWQYSQLPTRTELERLVMLLGKEIAYDALAQINDKRRMHGIRWKLMDRKTQREHKKELEEQFQEKELKLKKKVDWIKKKYSVVLRDYEFLYDVIELICPMVIDRWSYNNKMIVKPFVPKGIGGIADIKLVPVSRLVSINWKERLGLLIKVKMKKSGRSLYHWYQEYSGRLLHIESIWHTIIDDYYEFIYSAESQKRLVDKILEKKRQNGEIYQLSNDEFKQQARYEQSVHTMQHNYDDLIDCTKDLMCTLANMAGSLINSRNMWPDTETFTVHRKFFSKTENIPYTPSEDYAQLVRNETNWYEIAINPFRDSYHRVDIGVRSISKVYPRPIAAHNFINENTDILNLKKELEKVYPELMTVNDNLWSIIDYVIHNRHLKMNDIQKIRFQEIVSKVGIQLPDFMYLATGIQKFLERFREIFSGEGSRQTIVASS